MTLYEGLLFAHILDAVVWLAGSFTILLLWFRALRSDDRSEIGSQAATLRWLEHRVLVVIAFWAMIAEPES